MRLSAQNPGRLLKINEILKDNFKIRFGDYINVRIICGRSDVTINGKDIARFIFADEENHMSAVLYKHKSCPDSKKLYENIMKMENKVIRLNNFKIENEVPLIWRLLRNQSKRLILRSNSLHDVASIEEDEKKSKILKHFPFDFTPIADIGNSETGRIIDIIGLCISHDINVAQKHDHKKTTLFKNTRHKVYKEEPSHCKIEIFGELKTEISRKNEVYALMNLEKSKYNGETLIRTTDNTFIVRVTDDNLGKLIPDYKSKTFIMNLLVKRRTPRSNKQNEWHNDKENNFLMEASELTESPKLYITEYNSDEFDEAVMLNKRLKRRNSNCSASKNKKKLCLESKSKKEN